MCGPEEREGVELLERSVGYALCSVRPVTTALLSRSTPCRGWDLGKLLRHANDSLAALGRGVGHGCVDAATATGADAGADGDPVGVFRARASRLLGACAAGPRRGRRVVTVDGWPLATAALAATGALEIAVHGWDIARASGLPRPIPPALATVLLHRAPELVPEPAVRRPLFAPPVAVSTRADPSDRLVAYLGRDPGGGAGAR